MTVHVATCHTGGCWNEGEPVLLVDPEQLVACGPCMQVITDIVPPIPDPPPVEAPEPDPSPAVERGSTISEEVPL